MRATEDIRVRLTERLRLLRTGATAPLLGMALATVSLASLLLAACTESAVVAVQPDDVEPPSTPAIEQAPEADDAQQEQAMEFTQDSAVSDVVSDPAFGDWGRLLLPADDGYWSGDTLGNLGFTWYSCVSPDSTVEVANYLRGRAQAGEQVFFDLYTEEEKAADPAKADTGLVFFRGEPGGRFAVCNAGGGFSYVAAMHDGFPHALELSKRGYNAFALVYRPGAQTACEDLARAVAFVFEHADDLGVDTSCYSLWGGSAGARMAAWVGSYGTAAFGGGDLPQAGCVVMQYTGLSEYRPTDPPTYACVGTSDGIASWQGMERRLDAMAAVGIPTEFHAYEGLGHGFGLGRGTVAEGWLDDAVAFWERQMEE